MSDELAALHCAGCNAPALVDVGDGTVQCLYCNSIFAHPDRVCPKCGTVSDLDELDCPTCGHALRGLCPVCNAPNLVQASVCRRCGTPMDLLSSVAERAAMTASDFIYQRGAEADALKRREERSSQERLARMWEQDQERNRKLEAQRARQQRQEKLLATIAAGILIIIVIGSLLFFLLTQFR